MAIPHNFKYRYGERGAADAKPKAQAMLCALIEHFGGRKCRAAAAGVVLKPSGGNYAVLPYEKTATFCAFGVYTGQRDQNTGEDMLNLKCKTIHDHGGILYE